MSNSTKTEKCPNCGIVPRVKMGGLQDERGRRADYSYRTACFYVECPKCGARGKAFPISGKHNCNVGAAVRAWNIKALATN